MPRPDLGGIEPLLDGAEVEDQTDRRFRDDLLVAELLRRSGRLVERPIRHIGIAPIGVQAAEEQERLGQQGPVPDAADLLLDRPNPREGIDVAADLSQHANLRQLHAQPVDASARLLVMGRLTRRARQRRRRNVRGRRGRSRR